MIASVEWCATRTVTLKMSLAEFRETVEWLELIAPDDDVTRHWRTELDHVLLEEEER